MTGLGRILRILAVAAALGQTAGAEAAGDWAMPRGTPSIFNSTETASPHIAMFPKWTGALGRYFNESRLAEAPCDSSWFNRCHLREWTAFLNGLRGKPALEQVREVNAYLNRVRYIIDPRNYGVPDYWATPKEFLARNGDCEDYAITKYLSLRALGFKPDQLRIVVLQDLNLRVAHAILVVYVNGRAWVLDNQIRSVVSDRTIRHYRAIYSINEQFWWRHQS